MKPLSGLSQSLSQNLSQRAILALFSLLVFFVFFRSRYAFTIYSAGDDACYMGWLFRLIGSPELSQCDFARYTYSPGIALAWLPAGLLGKAFALMTGTAIDTWVPALVGATSFLFWVGALFVIARIAREFFKSEGPVLRESTLAILLIMNVPVLFYATHRNSMAHSGEFLACLLVFYFALKRRLVLSFVFAAWAAQIRMNDAPIFLVPMAAILDEWAAGRKEWIQKNAKKLAVIGVLIGIPALYKVADIAFISGYHGVHRLGAYWDAFNGGQFVHKMIGPDWGILWLLPLTVLGFVLALSQLHRLSWVARSGLLLVAINFFLAIAIYGNGSEFGHRYTIGSYAGMIVVWMELYSKRVPQWRKALVAVGVAGALWLTYATWMFKTKDNLSLWILPAGSWHNPTFQIELLKALLNPVGVVSPLGLSVPAVLVISTLFSSHPSLSRYAIEGPRYWVLAGLALIAGAMVITIFVRGLRKHLRTQR